jgi:hypothetical protein
MPGVRCNRTVKVRENLLRVLLLLRMYRHPVKVIRLMGHMFCLPHLL